MTSTEFLLLCRECESILRARAPYKTGNLRYNAIKLEMIDAHTCRLYVDEDIAPYMKYTNEPWEEKEIPMGNFKEGETTTRMRTWKNPNEGWFDKAAEEIAQHIARRTRGELKQS